jgi:hypothetical protein
MVLVLWAQTLEVSFPEIGFTRLTDFIFVRHSGTNTGLPCKIKCRLQGDALKVSGIWESTCRASFAHFSLWLGCLVGVIFGNNLG